MIRTTIGAQEEAGRVVFADLFPTSVAQMLCADGTVTGVE